MSRWFRHYAGMMRDDKLVRVSIRSKQTIERVVWVWGAILESAAEIDENGRYDFDAAEAAYFLRAGEDDVLAVARELENVGRVSQGSVVKWGDRQFQSDRSAERQRRYRERQKSGDCDGEQAGRESDSDAGVTSPKRHRDAPEAEAETKLAKASSARATIDVPSLMLRLCKAAGLVPPDPGCNFARHSEWLKLVADWLEAGADPAAIEERLIASPGKARSLKYFDAAVRETIAAKQAQATDADRMIAQIQARKAAA